MSQLEYLREKLYSEIEKGNEDSILTISQQLDEIILFYTLKQIPLSRQTA